MSKELEPLDDNKDAVQLDTDKLNKIMDSIDGMRTDINSLHDDMRQIRADMTTGDTATRAYVDKSISSARKEIDKDMKEIIVLFKNEVHTVVDSVVSKLLSPIAKDVSTFTEKSRHNEKEVGENAERIDKLFSNQDHITKQLTDELQTRITDNSRILFALRGDGETSKGVIGKLDELIAIGKQQEIINKQVEKHEKVFTFIQGINWRFVLISAGLISPSIVTLLEVLNII